MARWPIVQSASTVHGEPRSVCSTAQSWMFDPAPTETRSLSPRRTALNHTLASGPTSTSPTIHAPGATNAVGSMRGHRSP